MDSRFTFFKFFCHVFLCFRDHRYDKLHQGESSTSSNTQEESSTSSYTQGESSTSSKFSYDVFLSFSGKDIRKTFLSHLDHRLCQHGFQIFKDDKSLRKGDVISPALEKGIENSRISIVVLSTNYASSRWCLDELVKILECKEKLKQRVMPIFYDVLPTEVRKQTGKFGTEFAKLKKKCGTQRMKKRKAALIEVANLSGSELRELANRDESEFIEIIIQNVKKEVNPILLNVASYPVGVDSRAKDIIESLLQNGREHEVSMVGIHGVGGIGKTTLAKEMYNQSFQHGHFDGSCLLSDVKSQDENIGLHKLQEKLLNILLKSKDLVNCVDEGIKLMETRLRSKKVLIVLDDVDTERQLESLTKRSWFGSGSLIIITTRNKRVLHKLGEKERYEAKLLNDDEAMLLFCSHAFDNPFPPQDYVNLAQDIIKYSGRLPIALVTLGSHLHGRSIEEWNYEFKRLKAIPHEDIQKILKISFDGLPHDTKTVFLDIACTFPYFDIIKVLNACGFHTECEIATLVQKHLLQRNGLRLVMHDLVRDMGREIVRKESTQCPGGRSRLFISKEVCAVMLGNSGTKKVEVLRRRNTGRVGALEGLTVSTEVFQKMKNLRVLIIDDLCVSGDFGLFPKQLKYLSWRHCPLERIPSNFPAANLVFLNMQLSAIREFDLNLQCCPMLKELNLSWCRHLRRTPKFNGAESLQTLLLEGCLSLREIDQSICQLKSLQVLDITRCGKLQTLPIDLADMQSLRSLRATNTGIKQLPESVEKLRNLETLEVELRDGRSSFPQRRVIEYLSTSLSRLALINYGLSEADIHVDIGSLSSLISLDLSGNSFHHLPFDFSKLRFLKDLRLNDCENLQTLPSVSNLENLETLELRNCMKLVDITGLDNLRSIERIDQSICQLKSLQVLDIAGCAKLQTLPVDLADMQSLRYLCATYTDIKQLPESVEKLKNLETLQVGLQPGRSSFPQRRVIEYLSTSLSRLALINYGLSEADIHVDIGSLSSLKSLDLSGNSFHHLPFDFSKLRLLKVLRLNNCENLQTFPSVSNLENLKTLELRYCMKLVDITGLDNLCSIERIDQSLCQLKSLQVLDITGCAKLQTLPVDLADMQSLRSLRATYTGIKQLPESVEKLKNLETLQVGLQPGRSSFPQRRVIEYLSTSLSCLALINYGLSEADIHVDIGSLSSLKSLDLSGNSFHHLPFDFSKLRCLKDLRLNNCENLQTFLSVSNLENLETLELRNFGLSEADIHVDIGSLSSLKSLDLSRNNFHHLPFDFSKLRFLKFLRLNNCENLQTLPSVSNLENLETLELRNCMKLVDITGLDNLHSIKQIDMIGCGSLPNPFNEGFFTSKKYPHKFFQIDLQCNEIPDWCSNKVTAPSICLTVPRHDKEYKSLGMVLWFVCDCWDSSETGEFVVSVSHRERESMSRSYYIDTSYGHGELSYVYYVSHLNRPSDGQMIKGGEKITVHGEDNIHQEHDMFGHINIKKIGIYLLYLDQHGNVTSLPGEVDHSYSKFPEECSAGHKRAKLI